MRDIKKEVAKELEHFKLWYCDPLNERVDNGRSVMDGWDEQNIPGDKQKAMDLFRKLDAQNVDFHRLFHSINRMLDVYNQQQLLLLEVYNEWYNLVSIEGKQPTALMSSQVNVLQAIFDKIQGNIDLKKSKKK